MINTKKDWNIPQLNAMPPGARKHRSEKWLKEQPLPLEVYKQYDYEFIKKQLKKATLGEDTDTTLPESLGQQKSDFTLETASAGSQDKVSEFDDLFNE